VALLREADERLRVAEDRLPEAAFRADGLADDDFRDDDARADVFRFAPLRLDELFLALLFFAAIAASLFGPDRPTISLSAADAQVGQATRNFPTFGLVRPFEA
jgi:hypothetical protein